MKFKKVREKDLDYLFVLCKISSIFGLVISIAWIGVFVVTDHWKSALSLAILGIVVSSCWVIARNGRFSTGLMLTQLACLIFVTAFSLLFDISNAAAPRTTHVFLLVIALVGYINLQRESSWQQLSLIAACLLAFIVFTASPLKLSLMDPIPDTFHAARAWVNAVLATGFLCGGVAAMNAEFSTARTARELGAALSGKQFELFYQAQVDSRGAVTGAEALLRWKHPKRGYVAPADFIPNAEKSGFMPRLGGWVVEEACRTLASWQASPVMRDMVLAINVSAAQFIMPDFVEVVRRTADSHGISPGMLKLELTESVFVSDVDEVIRKMRALREAGFAIALDDFGTGYSSLSYLRQLPLTQLKIDRSFVRGVTDNPRVAAVTRNIIQMGHDLHLEILAEGIETSEQWQVMRAYGCTSFQGFQFARPLPRPEFERYALARFQPAAT